MYFSALFPILHLATDLPVIKELTDHPRKLARSLVVGGSKLGINQAVFVEKDQVGQNMFERNFTLTLFKKNSNHNRKILMYSYCFL